jgi:hypothetical protein
VVLAAECIFCVHFGREEKLGATRQRTKSVKFFTAPFRADNYKQHHTMQHPSQWEQYQRLSDDDKTSFFENVRPAKETLHHYFSGAQVTLTFLINGPIVDVIIGEMLWDTEDIDGETHSRMMGAFEDFVDVTENLPKGEGSDRYRFVIRNPVQLHLSIDYISVGCSFQQTARLLHSTKERTGLAAIGCTYATVAKYERFICAIDLQIVSEMRSKCWTFSVALDMSTHMSTSYLDLRLRVHDNRKGIVNAHFLATPVYERHTGEVIFDTCSKALNVLCPSWRDIIFGATTDGEKKMTGNILLTQSA